MSRIDVNSYKAVSNLLKQTGFSVHDLPLTGRNVNGETVILSASKDIENPADAVYRLETMQKNGWVRNNVFYKDGTEEEFYEH